MSSEIAASPLARQRPRSISRLATGLMSGEGIALALLLVGSGLLLLWNLGASGWANSYYSAAVLAGSKDWTAFLFGSFDAGNAITVDKTPASLWVMSLSARLFGFSSWSVLVPQALEGVAAVWLLYLAVRRRVGPLGGLVAGLVLALTPVATLMFRYNNPDALLTLLLVAAAYATIRALEHASTRWIVVAGIAIGFAFLAKMLQGFLVIPAFTAVYLIAAPTTLWRRVRQVGAAALSVILSAGWWTALVALWPAAARPYIGGSQSNSIIDLMLGYNGFGRITGNEVGRVGGGAPTGVGGFGGFGGPTGGPFSESTGWLRLFRGELGSNVSWLIPAALISLLALLWITRRHRRTDALRASALVWGGWLIVTGLVFSLMQGIFHPYYAVALVPPIGALIGLGGGLAWRRRHDAATRWAVAAVVSVSAVWATTLLGRSPEWNPWLTPAVLLVGGAAVAAILFVKAARRPLQYAVVAAALGAILLAPGTASIATAAEPHAGALPSTQPSVGGGGRFGFGFPGGRRSPRVNAPAFGQRQAPGFFGLRRGGPTAPPAAPFAGRRGAPAAGGTPFPGGPFAGSGSLGGLLDAAHPSADLVSLLQRGADGFRWVAATTGANNAAGLALASGQSVMAIGGFNGTDPSPTLAEFQQAVANGEIHYYVAGNDAGGFRGAQGGSRSAAQISAWVDQTYRSTLVGGVTVYDLTR